MHPAFSVIFFTTASGAGFGLFFWLGLLALCDRLPGPTVSWAALLAGALFAVAGLCSSVLHLGQPMRAWRAFSHWRSSWLSREGVVALATFVPAIVLAIGILQSPFGHYAGGPAQPFTPFELPVQVGAGLRLAGACLLLLSLATVACTAMIYASLKPVPAWTHPLVLPVYLVFALFCGGLLLCTILALDGLPLSNMIGLGIVAGALALWLLKWRAWHYVDHERAPVSRNDALGLPHARPVQVFERPHTEANYLLKEMGYVLARRHARKLRAIAVVLFALVPALLALPLWLLPHFDAGAIVLPIALLSALGGALVERWLFFAEARHLVTLYY
jgi:DMSO reductase anchor subunit